MNIQIFTVCTGKSFLHFTGDFFKPLHSTSSVHCREGCLKAVLQPQSLTTISAHHHSSGSSLELPSRSSRSRCFLQTEPAKRFFTSCLLLLCMLQTKCCALCQVKEEWLGKNWSCKASLLSVTLSAWQSLPCLLDFLTGDSMSQGRNRPLEKEHISSYLWVMPLPFPDVSAHLVQSLIYQVPSFLCALGFLSQLRRWENGEKE